MAVPVTVTVAPLPPGPVIVPVMLKDGAEVKFAVLLALRVTAWLAGVYRKPVLLGVTV